MDIPENQNSSEPLINKTSSINFNEDLPDKSLPKSCLNAFAKDILKANKIRGDSKVVPMLESIAKFYVRYVSTLGCKICTNSGKKTLNVDHVIEALREMGLESHINKLQEEIKKNDKEKNEYEELKNEKNSGEVKNEGSEGDGQENNIQSSNNSNENKNKIMTEEDKKKQNKSIKQGMNKIKKKGDRVKKKQDFSAEEIEEIKKLQSELYESCREEYQNKEKEKKENERKLMMGAGVGNNNNNMNQGYLDQPYNSMNMGYYGMNLNMGINNMNNFDNMNNYGYQGMNFDGNFMNNNNNYYQGGYSPMQQMGMCSYPQQQFFQGSLNDKDINNDEGMNKSKEFKKNKGDDSNTKKLLINKNEDDDDEDINYDDE